MDDANQITREAYERLVAQHRTLTEREIVDARSRLVAIQEGGGDAEGLEGVEAVFEVERITGTIARLERIIASAVIVEPGSWTMVAPGCTVELDFGDGVEQYTYESITSPSAIGPTSPLGVAIAGRSAGDTVEVSAPGGSYTVRIISVR